MKKQINTWQLIQKSLENNIPVLLFYVVESIGSSPGRQGFFMALSADNEMEGSIGGGIMEYKFVEMGKEILRERKSKILLKKQVHDKKAGNNKSGMICSGEQTLLVYPVKKKDLKSVIKILNILQENKTGSLTISPESITVTETQQEELFTSSSEDDWKYVQNIGYKNHLYIIGGGHCSLALSNLMRMMDFYIHIFDDRKDLNTMQNNQSAHEKIYLNSYLDLADHIPSGENNYVVIMTFGYRSDDDAMRTLMNKKYHFLGCLGSKKKIGKMFQTYKEEGISENILNRIHAPIGIRINSRTTEEIAVSIAAEIIKVKNEFPK